MQFLVLLSLMAGAAGCMGAVLAGINTGALHLIIGWIVGLMVGFACCWVAWSFGKWTIRRFKLHEPEPPLFRLILSWLLCGVIIAWAFVSAFIGSSLTKFFIHLCQ